MGLPFSSKTTKFLSFFCCSWFEGALLDSGTKLLLLLVVSPEFERRWSSGIYVDESVSCDETILVYIYYKDADD